jgi:hypothetical protein
MVVFVWMWLGAVERPYDGVDQDGDGQDLVDVDGDGWPSELVFGGDCNDRDASVHPHARDRWGDGVDADCDGADGDPTSWRRFWVAVTGRGRRPSARGLLPSRRLDVQTRPSGDRQRR